eukprot:TRINITY_DN2577_c0_g1_i10.p1 TRINITY_DN2577_c0_g1~~TRINITY_DN2577_c0_g1_i10.p1  ORF type:complete len:192 (-),score=36.16 TRINITY_DN2577_c0_g1_i10:61-636(-)
MCIRDRLSTLPLIQPQNIKTVHFICHSHQDVGWVKTIDEYYTQEVKNVYNRVFAAMKQDSKRKFVAVEMAFVSRYWYEANESLKQDILNFIQNGQLEILNGGWVMNDEAAAYYEDIVDQMTIGHRFSKETFNYVPKAGWQIDPFGHSNSQALLYSQMGMDSWFIERMDYEDFETRKRNKALDIVMLSLIHI